MTSAPSPKPVAPIDPTSPRGIKAAHDLGVIRAAVIDRLRREGRPVPGDPSA